MDLQWFAGSISGMTRITHESDIDDEEDVDYDSALHDDLDTVKRALNEQSKITTNIKEHAKQVHKEEERDRRAQPAIVVDNDPRLPTLRSEMWHSCCSRTTSLKA